MPKYYTELTVEQWGPTYWKLLHILGSCAGTHGDVTDADVANSLYFLVNLLPDVLPCKECAAHARDYFFTQKFDPRGKTGVELRTYVATALLNFHNAVRLRKGQPITFTSVAQYLAFYATQKWLPCDSESLDLFIKFGKMHAIINLPKYARWDTQFRRIKLLVGL